MHNDNGGDGIQRAGDLARRFVARTAPASADEEAAAADRLARWLVGQLAGLQYAAAYKIAAAVSAGRWPRAEMLRVLRITHERRRAEGPERLHNAAVYFVVACKNEIERRGLRWKSA